MPRNRMLIIAPALVVALGACAEPATGPANASSLEVRPGSTIGFTISCRDGSNAPAPDGVVVASGPIGANSLNSDTPTLLRFTNASCTTVSVYWLDFSGERVLYAVMNPGESYVQGTYLTHPWVIVRPSDGAVIASFMPVAGYGVAYISLPNGRPLGIPRGGVGGVRG